MDPVIEVRPSLNQIDDLMEEIQQRIEKEERVLVTTLTKRMAEELTEYLLRNDIRCNYIHSDVDTLERVKIMDELRQGIYDVLVGVKVWTCPKYLWSPFWTRTKKGSSAPTAR